MHADKKDLKRRVGVNPVLPDNDEEQGRPDNSNRKLPETSLYAEDHAGKRDQRCGQFEWIDVQIQAPICPGAKLPRAPAFGNRYGMDAGRQRFSAAAPCIEALDGLLRTVKPR